MEDLISFMRWHKEHGPAPKEEVMEPILDGQPRIDGKLFNTRTAERRARFERAYMAALGGYCSRPYYDAPDGQRQELNPSRCARIDALETVRQWDAMMAELDGEEG